MGPDKLSAFPVFRSTKICALNREQRAVRTLRPHTTGKHNEEWKRPARHRPPRRRPLPSRRRQEQRERGGGKQPSSANNFNNTMDYERQWVSAEMTKSKVYKYSTLYNSQIRAAASTGGPTPGPLNMRQAGPTTLRLAAEYGATPGKRLHQICSGYDTENVCQVTTMVKDVRGPYRQHLLRRRLTFVAKEKNVGPPTTYICKVPDQMAWTKPHLRRCIHSLLRVAKRREWWKGCAAQEFTKLAQGRDEKYTDGLANEKAVCRAYDQAVVDTVPEPLREKIKPGILVRVSNANWDVAVPMNFDMLQRRCWGILTAWRTHFFLPLSEFQMAVEMKALMGSLARG